MKVIGRKYWPRPQGISRQWRRHPKGPQQQEKAGALQPHGRFRGLLARKMMGVTELPSGYLTLVDMEHDPFRADIYDPIIDRFIPSYPHYIPWYPMIFLPLFSLKYPFFHSNVMVITISWWLSKYYPMFIVASCCSSIIDGRTSPNQWTIYHCYPI